MNGVTFDYPQTNDTDWGPDATGWAAAVTNGMLQKAGGVFQLTAEADFGTSFGLKSLYYKSRTANPASAGQIRFGRPDLINWRNQANSGDLSLGIDSSDNLVYNGVPIVGSFTVADTATIDLDLTATVLTANINSLSITNAMIATSAAIAYSKLNLTGSIGNADISNSASIAFSKLSALPSANIIVGNGSNVAAAVPVTGDIAITNAGVTSYNGVVPLAKGGTAKALTAVAGAIAYSDADSLELTAAGTAGQILKSNGSSAPTWVDPEIDVVKSVPSDYTALVTDNFIHVNAGSGVVTISLYTAVGNLGRKLTIKKTDSTFNKVIIDGAGTETLDGALTRSLATQYESVTIESDNFNWLVTERYIDGSQKTFTPSGGSFTTNTTYSGSYYRRNTMMMLVVRLSFAGAPNSVTLNSVTIMPSGLTMNTSLIPPQLGIATCNDTGVNTYQGQVVINNSTSVQPIVTNVASTYASSSAITQAVPFTIGNGDAIIISLEVPITEWVF